MKNREAFANDAEMYQKEFDRANVGCAVILAGSNDFALLDDCFPSILSCNFLPAANNLAWVVSLITNHHLAPLFLGAALRHSLIKSLGLALVLGFASNSRAEFKVEEKIVGPELRHDVVYTYSMHGLHTGVAAMEGSRYVVLIDGVPGPKFEQITPSAARVELSYERSGFVQSLQIKEQTPVALSPDGSRYAYCGREGKDVKVICDGKEVFAAPATADGRTMSVSLMSFTPDGKRLFFFTPTTDTMQSFALVMDGVAEPACNQGAYPRFSPDGSRYTYVGENPRNPAEKFLIIDGKPAEYLGLRPRFTPDSKRIISVGQNEEGLQTLLIDGKPSLTLRHIELFVISPTSDRIAVVGTDSDGKKSAFMDGKVIDDTEGAYDVFFSPDGKRLAISCYENPSAYMIVDGKRHQNYNQVSNGQFTGDSSKFIYTAIVGQQQFVVCENEEFGGFMYMIRTPIVGPQGPHYAFAAGTNTVAGQNVHIDGKPLPTGVRIHAIQFSPDGSRYAALVDTDALSKAFILDGQVLDVRASSLGIFSDDGKHYAMIAAPGKGPAGLILDGEFLPLPMGLEWPQLLCFTPDGRHIVMQGTFQQKDGSPGAAVYMDGARAAEFKYLNVATASGKNWDMAPDGTFVIVGRTDQGLKRVQILPSTEDGLAKMKSDYEAAQAKVIADAEAAATQAAADAEKKQLDAEAAQAEAARKKAEAIEAKKLQREEAARKKAEAAEAKRLQQEEAKRLKAEAGKTKPK